MSAADPSRPGRRRDCPAWCEVDHGAPLDPVHRGLVATIDRGDTQLIITVRSDPRQPGPGVAVDAWDLAAGTSAGLILLPAQASELAGIMAAAGRADIAGYLRHAVDLLSEAGSGGVS